MPFHNAKEYVIYDSTNDIWYENVVGLSQFCKSHNLCESSMRDVSKNRQLYQHRGFYCTYKKENSKDVILLKLSQKKYNDLSARFNKLSKPIDKVKRYNQSAKYVDFINKIEEYYETYYVTEKMSCRDIANMLGVDAETIREHFVNNDLKRTGNFKYASKIENDFRNYLKSITGEEFSSDRNIIAPLEIDCYSPKYNIGFEFCGSYWHSELHKKKNYHFFKYRNALEKNIRLIHIFEHEWLHRQQQIKNFIKAQLGIFEKRIYGRDCSFQKIDIKQCKTFFDAYHIQSAPNNIKYCFGLYYNEELIGAISYAPHHRINDVLSLNRLAFKDNIQIVGGVSKLIKNSLTELDECEIITWSDNRWSSGKIYSQNGFVFDEDLYADYVYFNTKTQLWKSKQSMKKSSLQGLLENETEHEWALRNHWVRIFDCGKKRWKFRR